ncbi:hypothetical protein [Dactylosporangium salmoneum]|uniref:Uncharacterized protein n=1 Tax=Dactylosporangium salmoneum TaxID=53361 RepID=A0ABN3FLJ1_9ACTN
MPASDNHGIYCAPCDATVDRLRQHPPTVPYAINAFGPQNTRSTVLNQVGLAGAYFLADAPDLALKAGDIARRQAGTLTSPRVNERIANLRRHATQHLHLPEVADFVRALPRPTPVA